MTTPETLAFRLALTGREPEAKNVELPGTDALSPHVWEFLRGLKVDRESFVLYDSTRGRRIDPDWPCAQAGLMPGALVMVGDPTDFPDPLADYRAVLQKIRINREWPITEETGHELLAQREHLAVTKLEHMSLAAEARMPPDDANVLWDWKPREERLREEYQIFLKQAKAKPEAAVRKLSELRTALNLSADEHMDLAARAGLDAELAARLLEGGAAPMPQAHLDYVAALTAARNADFSTETLQVMRDQVVRHKHPRELHLKLAAQAGIAPELADACFEDKEMLAVGRNMYKRELLAANKLKPGDAVGLARLKVVRERYQVKRPEHMRIAKEWGIPEKAAEALWELKPPPEGLTRGRAIVGAAILGSVALISPPGQHAVAMMYRGVIESFQPASPYDADGFDAKGFDRNGYDRRGLDRNGYDRSGYDIQGYDKTGFDRNGFDRARLDRHGRDKDGYDKDGYDVRGLDRRGFNKEGRDKEGYDVNGLDKSGYDRGGFNAQGLNREGYNRQGRDKDGFDHAGYDLAGYDRKGFNKAGVDRKGFDKTGRDKEGYDKDGFDTTGFNREGYDREGYDKSGYDKQGYDRGGLDRRGLDKQGNARPRGGSGTASARPSSAAPAANFGPDGFGADGYDRAGRDRDGFDRAGFGRDGFNRQGRNRWNLDRSGFDPAGYDRDGFDRQGFNRDGVDKRGFRRDGRDKDGFDRQGFNARGYDREGRGRDGADLLPGNLATLQGESATEWVLRSGDGGAYKVGAVVPPFNVRLERVGGNVIHFRHEGVLYERKILK